MEGEPLIPPTTRFVLTTNRALVPSSSGEGSNDVEFNTSAYGRYFDRPEVQKACQAQELIQTPEYTQLSDDALVGGRFRPRNSDEVRTYHLCMYLWYSSYFLLYLGARGHI